MKRRFIFLILFLLNINLFAVNEFYMMDYYLLSRGYTKYDPKFTDSGGIFRNAYRKVFGKEWDMEGTPRLFIDYPNNDGLLYLLIFLNNKRDTPNFVAITWLENNGVDYGYYKINYNFEGTKMYTIFGKLIIFL